MRILFFPTRSFFVLTALMLLSRAAVVQAELVGPYTPDANTLFLFHFDEAAGGSVTTNVGIKGGNSYSVDETIQSTTPPLVTTMLGAAGYATNSPTAISFGNCMTNPTSGYLFGYDFNNSGAYQGDNGGFPNPPALDAMAMTNFNLGNGGQSAFTLEALIRPTTTAGSQEIICTDSSQGSRGFQFRINAGSFQFQSISPSAINVSGTIPTTGPDAFVAGAWYHVAVTYDGTTARLYWTRLDPSVGAAHLLNSGALTLDATRGAITGPFIIGNENRNVAGERFAGSIDEVRISNVARAANQMQFFSPLVTITQNPVSQNVDYNQPVTFSVGASSLTALGYQWRYNSNSIANATNSSYVIANVATVNAGYYDVIVTNTSGNSATSSPALLVVGAANFLNHRYSFTTDTRDSIGTAHGTNFGNATVTGGALVLDGTDGTYMELPGNLFNSANATALTVEFWATFGVNANLARVFDFGTRSVILGGSTAGFNYVGFTPRNGNGDQQLHISPGDNLFEQRVTAPGALDERTVHIACVIDPPNKILSVYTNGVLESINTNMTVNLANLNDAVSFIGRSLFSTHPYLNASIDELRLYNGALAGLSIKQSEDQGPNTLLADGPAQFVLQPANTSIPAGQIVTFTAAAVGYLPITYQWFRGAALIPGATNSSYSFATMLADNSATFRVYATNTIGVTTYVTNSTTATLTVFTPPTLAWLDLANGGADGDWNTSSLNWTNVAGGGPLAFSQTNAVLFDNRGSGAPNVNLVQALSPSKITVDSATDYLLVSGAGNGSLTGQGTITKLNSGKLIIDLTNNLSGAVTISSGTLQVGNNDTQGSLGSAVVTNNATLSISRSDTALNVFNAIHGSGTVSFDGGGTVTVSGTSDYSGSTLINSGVLNLQSTSGLGATSGSTALGDGGQLYVTANVDLAENLTLRGGGPDGSGALRKGGAGLTTEFGTVILASDSVIGLDNGATLVLSNTVSGSAALTIVGGGNLTLSAANTYNGGTTLSAGIVNVNANAGLGSGPVTISGAGRFLLGTGVSVANAFVANSVSPGTATGLIMVGDNTNGTVTTVSGPITFNTAPVSGGNFYGPFSSGYLNVTGRVTNNVTGDVSARNGLVRFSGGGDYTLFDLKQGTTSIGAHNGLATDASLKVASSGGATFDLNGFNQTLAGLTDGGAFQELITNSAGSPSTLTLNLTAGSTYNGVIAGNVSLVVNGAASLLLSGTNAYTGNTTVNGGTLEIAQPTLATNSTVTVANGAVLQLDFAVTNKVAALVLNGVSQPAGVYSSATSSPFIIGTGSLEVAVSVASNPTNITFSASGGNLTLTWPASHLGWILQSQTNSLSIGLITNWFDVTGSGSSTQAVININATNPAVFFRLRHP